MGVLTRTEPRGHVTEWVILGFWLLFVAYWLFAARNVRPSKRVESLASRLGYNALLVAGGALLAIRFPFWSLNTRWVPASRVTAIVAVLLTGFGVNLAVWARAQLGRNWSARVTLKQDHELIRTGPYAVVRHPIYTGILVGILGSAVLVGELRGLLGFTLFASGFAQKIRREERWLTEEFGDAYRNYARATKRLIPGIW